MQGAILGCNDDFKQRLLKFEVDPKALEDIIDIAWISLVLWGHSNSMFSDANYPEVLLLDRCRLVRMKKFVYSAIVTAVVAISLDDAATKLGRKDQMYKALQDGMNTIWLSESANDVCTFMSR